MNVNKNELKKALDLVKPGLSNSELIEQSTSFAFMGDRVVTYNDEISISHPLTGIEITGSVKATYLYQFLAKIKKDEIEFEVEGNELLVKSGKAKAGLVFESEIKLPLEEIEKIGKWKKLPTTFIKHVSLAMKAATSDLSRPILTCVHIRKDGIIEASDGFMIMQCWGEELPSDNFLLPAKLASIVASMEPTHIYKGSSWVHFKTSEGTILSCRIFDETFPDTEPHLTAEGETLKFPATMQEIIDKAIIFCKNDYHLSEEITITVENNKVKVHSESEGAWFEEVANMKYNKEEISFKIAPYLLKDILSSNNECLISEDGAKLLFEGEDWKYLALLKG